MQKFNLADFDAVAFDVEGTLADTIPAHHTSRLESFDLHGYGHITHEQHGLGVTYGSTTADIVGGILHATGHIEKTGPFSEHPEVQKIIVTKDELFTKLAAQGFEEMPGAIDFVHAIAKHFAGRMALVTSANERFVLPFLERYKLGHYFSPELIVSEDTVITKGLRSKPAPDPYRLAMERLGSKKLLVFEDTVPGTAAAKAAGATVIALGFEPNNTRLLLSEGLNYPPDAVVHSYAEAKQLLGLSL